ncbi:hypothetical protein D9611_009147 [Ephemerocybe angulata]|uniref:C2H2-type domain-containing protein n=1 Tax=Ephemerocybe angulata TaxID=980116 RepID=A0A8H5FK69_9AGAR|nr:hypothetical protein D9611_009147 [Tulosesus angulatus]
MRVSFLNLLTALGALCSLAKAYHDDYIFGARDNLDEFTSSTRSLDRREILADIASRDLLDEVADRLEARGWRCLACDKYFEYGKVGDKEYMKHSAGHRNGKF